MELVLVGLFFFAINIFWQKIKEGGGVVEEAGMQLSNDQEYNQYNQLVGVKCPYCKTTLYIPGQGNWQCEKCEQIFVYYKNIIYKQENIHSIFAIYMISILAKFCKIDGRVTKTELEIVENNINTFLGNTHEEMKGLKSIFNVEIKNVDNYEEVIERLYEFIQTDVDHKKNTGAFLLETMLQIGVCDENRQGIHLRQQEMIFKIIAIFNIDMDLYEQLKSKYIKKMDYYYQILECDRNATEEYIKRKYRELSKKYHPDILASKDLPPEIIELTSNKFREINEAYSTIMQSLKGCN